MTPASRGGEPEHPYVSRGGVKLAHALEAFQIDTRGLVCADLGCSTGGFTDALLHAGAASVVSVDTAYGELAWKLRNDPRVTVRERENALHARPVPGGVDLVVIDLGWTPQARCVPAALRWLRPGGRVVTLIKPHYELRDSEKALLRGGVLGESDALRVAARTIDAMLALGADVLAVTRSPVLGGKTGKGAASGNAEWLALLAPAAQPASGVTAG